MKKPFFKTFVVILTVLGSTLLLSLNSFNSAPENNAVLIQLFTSQGCSSCPPADRLLNEISDKYADRNVHVLSYHVDYWDRLGWKDTFSQKAFSEKQYAYAKTFQLNTVYTPQAIVNGATEFVGSNRSKMETAIQEFSSSTENARIDVRSERVDDSLHIAYNISVMQNDDILTFSLFIIEKNTAVARGENRGKSLLSKNIVIKEKSAKQKEGEITIEIPKEFSTEKLGTLAYLKGKDGKIRGVSKEIELKTIN